ncbi:Zinc finger CCCH domain-containing protein 54 [Asimina triloba]
MATCHLSSANGRQVHGCETQQPSVPFPKFGDGASESDDFRMYVFKIKRCSKSRSHDWTECPYAHRGEKARRRDPRKFGYCGIACPEFRGQGACRKGNSCEFAHGVFEFWLHPARYRTRACKAGRECQRKVCFFAHTPEQLRSSAGTKYRCGCEEAEKELVVVVGSAAAAAGNGEWELLDRLKGLKIGEEEEEGFDTTVDSPDIDWVSELVD